MPVSDRILGETNSDKFSNNVSVPK